MRKEVMIMAIVLMAGSAVTPAVARGRGYSNVRVRTERSEEQKTVTGQVTENNVLKRSLTVNGTSFDLMGRVPVTVNGATGSTMQIKTGDNATVQYTVRITTTIRSGRGSSSSSNARNDGKKALITPDSIAITRQ